VSRFALLAACGLLLAAGGCGGDDDDSPGGVPATHLRVTVWPKGPDGPALRHLVVCPGEALCRGVTEARLRPVPADVACTEIYGGPATARVRGSLDGTPVDVRFERTNGCEIARWHRNAALLRGG
jgi:hypothetical protein